jgi:hypothetical protein
MAKRNYYTLAIMEDDGKWYPQFGDYDLQCVKDERAEFKKNGVPFINMKIVTTGVRQSEVNAAIAKLNSGDCLSVATA